jgi:amino acid permease
LFAPGGFTVPDLIFSYFGAWFFIFNFCLWKIKGIITKTQKGFGISKHEMDFVSDLDEIERMTEDEKISRKTREEPANFLQKVDRVLFEGKY